MSIVVVTEKNSFCKAVVNNQIVSVKYSNDELLTGIVLYDDFGFIIFEVPQLLSAVPTLGHFVPISEDECAALGIHDSEDGGAHIVVTEFLSYQDNETYIHEDVYIKTGS